MSVDHAGRLLSAGKLGQQGQLAEAIAICDGLIAERPGDPDAIRLLGRLHAQAGHGDAAVVAARRLIDLEPTAVEEVATWGWTMATEQPDAGHRLVRIASDRAIGKADWESAAAVLEEFLARVPGHLGALIGLIHIARRGDLEATLLEAMAQLADRYLADGAVEQAKVMAEELLTRAPWERAHLERLRRVLKLCGEEDPDAIIARRLAGDRPFTAEDAGHTGQTCTGELDSLLGQFDAESSQASAPMVRASGDAIESTDDDYLRGRALHESGEFDASVRVLTSAWKTSSAGFQSAALLGGMYRSRGQLREAIEWLERAASVPAPEAELRHGTLYQLADALEVAGEVGRALAVCLELQADAGAYRDVHDRITRLARGCARG